MDQCDQLDPFSSESLWRPSKFSIEALQPLESVPWNAALPEFPRSCFEAPNAPNEKIDRSLWKLDFFPSGLEPPESATDSTIDPSIDGLSDAPCDLVADTVEDENNIWSLDSLREDDAQVIPQKSWETHTERSFQEPVSAYFSESGPKGFDAALAKQTLLNCKVPSRLAQADIYLRSLLRLGLGWNSCFFRYNQHTKQFEEEIKDVRVSGVSSMALDNVVRYVLQCGAKMHQMRLFAQEPPPKCKELSTLFTLSRIIAVIIFNLEQQISGHPQRFTSLLQIRALFERCGDLMGALAAIVDTSQKAASDAQILSIVTQSAASFAQRFGWMENLLHEIVIRVTEPWFKLIDGWIGLRPEDAALEESITGGKTFIAREVHQPGKFKTGPARIEHIFQADHIPSFIPADQAYSIFESGRSLRMLKQSHPNHPIARHDVFSRAGDLHLHCATSWADIENIQTTAQEYESKLRAEIKRYHKHEPADLISSSEAITQIPTPLTDASAVEGTFELFDIDDEINLSGPFTDRMALSKDNFNQILDKAQRFETEPIEHANHFGPELTSGLHLSLAPIISSQALLIDYSCLHHLFKEHKMRDNLNLQWRFQLLGEGSFVSRLSNSLFDSEMESGERKAGVIRTGVDTGLRLGSRDTWPPASSELRLVLIGLLGDCYFGNAEPEESEKGQSQKDTEMPGGLSFGIRDLSDEEIDKCKDPSSIEALDFLRLQYTPPVALESIITPRSLDKYDCLFKHLLRLLRMVSVVKSLVRDSTMRGSLSGDTRNVFQKFRVEAQHFVLAISDYCFHIGIGSIWQRFQETLAKIEYCLDRGDIDGTIEAAHSVPRLRDYHEDMLDQMLFAFFLSKRHAQAAKLLESIFGTILAFSPLSKADGSGLRHEAEGTAFYLYQNLHKQTSAFVGYLRNLESGKATSKSMVRSGAFFSSHTDATSVFEHLRVRLDFKKYY